MKKIKIIEIIVVLLVIGALAIYFAPNLINKQQDMLKARIKAGNAVFASKVLEKFSTDKNIKPSKAAQSVVDELNEIEENPYDKSLPAYTFDKDCKNCNCVEYDDNLSMVIVTTYDSKGELYARTVIKPPSFVTFYKDEDKKN